MSNLSNIADYISDFSDDQKGILLELYSIIQKYVPKETLEKISYGMPTFYYNGNLIHFAMHKNHLGLYPGTGAINHFKDQLQAYKTSKGTVQFPLNQPLPEKLIAGIIAYNVSIMKDKKQLNSSKTKK